MRVSVELRTAGAREGRERDITLHPQKEEEREVAEEERGGACPQGDSDLMWDEWLTRPRPRPPQHGRTDGTQTEVVAVVEWAGGGPLYLERAPSCRRPCDSSSTLGSLWRGGRGGDGGWGSSDQFHQVLLHPCNIGAGGWLRGRGEMSWVGGAQSGGSYHQKTSLLAQED